MAGSNLTLVIDRQNRKLVSYLGSPAQMPDLFQNNVISLAVQVVDPPAVSLTTYSLVDLAGVSLRVEVSDTPVGNASATLLALQDTFTWDPVGKKFTADLGLNTAAVDSFIGALSLRTAYFEVNLAVGNRTTILQTTFNLKAIADKTNSTVPAPSNIYPTLAEVLALLTAKQDRIIKSPSLTYGRELGVTDTGDPTESIGPL